MICFKDKIRPQAVNRDQHHRMRGLRGRTGCMNEYKKKEKERNVFHINIRRQTGLRSVPVRRRKGIPPPDCIIP
jgi:hypothetical protein